MVDDETKDKSNGGNGNVNSVNTPDDMVHLCVSPEENASEEMVRGNWTRRQVLAFQR